MKRMGINLWVLLLILLAIVAGAIFIIGGSGIVDDKNANELVTDNKKQYEDYQLIVVSATGNTAKVSLLDRDCEGSWTETLTTHGFIGQKGLGKTEEGDMKTPIGKFSITDVFGIKENPGTVLPYTKVDDNYYWVDDSNSKYYNKFVTTKEVDKDWNSAERIIDETIAYGYVLALDYNAECTPGAGSAIGIHVLKNGTTSGCIAIPENDMIELLKNIKKDCKVVIDYSENIDRYLN